MNRIALVMIARNEARCIGRALGSALALVDEMIVVDTGSADDTAAIARALGAQVHSFRWTDDFAAARNAALAFSTADWNLVLDADEWIDPAADHTVLAALRARAPFIGLLPVASEFDLQGRVELATSWIPRLLPRGVRYEGRIHEQPVSTLARERVALRLLHDGYREQELALKKGRNRRLLEQALAEAPRQPYLLYQLGKDFEVYDDYPDAVQHYAQALALVDAGAAFRHDLVVRQLFALKKCGQHAAAVELAEAEMANWQNSPDFFFVLGDLLLDWASCNPAIGPQLLPTIESSWLNCLDIGERPGREGAVAGRGSYLAAHNLAVLYGGLGDAARAARFAELAAARPAAG
jgi:hypothetical protein